MDSSHTEGTVTTSQRCEAIYALKPESIKGSINLKEARFLHGLLMESAPRQVAELGTCSGLSTAVMADALHLLNKQDGGARRLLSYDLMHTLFYDPSQKVGFFLASVEREVRETAQLRLGCTALNLREDFAPESLEFLMIDANHAHPWPCLDLLVCLPLLHPDATVCLHDINLPLVNAAYPIHGAKYAFDALPLDKRYSEPTKGFPPNMGAVRLQGNKEHLRDILIKCICQHPWEGDVERQWLVDAGLFNPLADIWRVNQKKKRKGILARLLARLTPRLG